MAVRDDRLAVAAVPAWLGLGVGVGLGLGLPLAEHHARNQHKICRSVVPRGLNGGQSQSNSTERQPCKRSRAYLVRVRVRVRGRGRGRVRARVRVRVRLAITLSKGPRVHVGRRSPSELVRVDQVGVVRGGDPVVSHR